VPAEPTRAVERSTGLTTISLTSPRDDAPSLPATTHGPGSRTSDYDYTLSPDRIARVPVEPRDRSRLLVVDRSTGALTHRTFRDLPELIPSGDVLVLNTTRVTRARLLGKRTGSGAPAEIFLLRPLGDNRFEALVHPGGKLGPGRQVIVSPELSVDVLELTPRRTRIVGLNTSLPIEEAIERYGHVPLPPYITRADIPADATWYQTVYAREAGSVAAPTAGLHFTPELLERLTQGGVQRADVVLHVGAGTFKPVESDDPAAHVMHEEWYSIPTATEVALNAARRRGAHVWAVGTTSARTIESAATPDGRAPSGANETRLFIRPPYEWRAVDRLITNFHLPRSTLLMLVAAFAGYELTMRAYNEALANGYRFLSYGDAMVVI
jgi:S-adenosylmethionine:tRNA ribosyltransferase-isomerase